MKKINNKNGQSTIEFLISFIFAFSFIFLFLKISLNFTNGYLVHYGVYMASRAYLVADINSNEPAGSDGEAKKIADRVFASFKLEQFLGEGIDLKVQVNSPESVDVKTFVGPYVEYETSFGLSALLGGKRKMTMRSESFLGREPTRSECLEQVCATVQALGSGCEIQVTLSDNGC